MLARQYILRMQELLMMLIHVHLTNFIMVLHVQIVMQLGPLVLLIV